MVEVVKRTHGDHETPCVKDGVKRHWDNESTPLIRPTCWYYWLLKSSFKVHLVLTDQTLSHFGTWSHEPQRLKYIDITKDRHEFSFTFDVFVQMVRELTELLSQEIIKIKSSAHSFLTTFERVARKKPTPSEPSTSEFIWFIGSGHWFLMSFKKVSRAEIGLGRPTAQNSFKSYGLSMVFKWVWERGQK